MATEAQYPPPLTGDSKEIHNIRIGLIGTCKDIQKGKAILAEARYREWKKQQTEKDGD
jgi:hypothetical protein